MADNDVVIDDDGPVPSAPVRPRLALIETTVGPYFRLIIENCREHEAREMMDLLRSRGWL